MSWHTGPLCGFDTETSGTDVESDRLVTATVVRTDWPRCEDREWLISPGVPIPAAASEVHGISDEHAREHGMDPAVACKEIADELARQWDAGAPVVAFNAPFDLTLLDRELRRWHGDPLEVRGPVIDPLVLDKHIDPYRKGKRTLGAACAHYAVRLEGAHSSAGDALAACRLAWRLATVYPQEFGDLAALHEKQIQWRAEQCASLEEYFRKKGTPETVDPSWPLRPLAAVS